MDAKALMIEILFCLNNMRHIIIWKRRKRLGKTDRKRFIHWVLMRKKSIYTSIQDVLKISYEDKQDILPRHLADVQKMP